MLEKMLAAYRDRFGSEPTCVVRAPGRVNLIGEHTDYNDGFVMPMAIDRAVWIALAPREDRKVEIYSMNYEETEGFDLDALEKGDHGWIEYVKGVAWALGEKGCKLSGWQGVMYGDVPLGAGLSSSAALELGIARAFVTLGGLSLDETELALVGQRAENKWVGVNCGIMDQQISSAGRAGYALLIDCRSLEMQPAPLPEGTAVVILDTATRRGLESSAYNERRSQCEAGAKFFGVSHLRDVEPKQFEAQAGPLDELTRRRCRHVITENARTLQAAEAMKAGDAAKLGELMKASHTSLRDDYEVSCPELDAMAEIAQQLEGCYGARMTGAGFGGCAVALIDAAREESFVASIREQYQDATGLEPNIYVSQPTDGARAVWP